MNDFKGLSRDTSWVKTPSDMWQFARNILLTSQYLSIANEKGNEYGYDIPGRVIGYMVTNEDIVYLSIDGSYTCIGYVNYLNEVYVPVLRTMNPNFKFKPSCPIEGICLYNYKKELIIIFSDGINKDSTTPKLINLHKPQANLTANKEFVDEDDYTMFELFSPISLPNTTFDYNAGNLKAEIVHIAFTYVFEDDTESSISPILYTNYPSFKGLNTIRHKINYKIKNLSPNFKKIRLYFVVGYNASLNGYATSILNIVNNEVEYSLSSVENLEIVAPEKILISSARFSKIKTITKTDNQILIGNVEQTDRPNLQIYANKLRLKLHAVIDIDHFNKYKAHPSLLPDEVYSIKIVPLYIDGTKGNALHIPGRLPIGNENSILTNTEIANKGLDFDVFKDKGYKRFHLENSGTINPIADFGYWENEDVYPQKDYFNSSSIGGEDLRGKPVRYHRIPELNNQGVKYNFGAIASGDIPDGIGHNTKFYVSVTNFDEVFPASIRKYLQGYELVIEKRQLGGTYIETNGFLYRASVLSGPTNNTDSVSIDVPFQFPRRFTNAGFVSAEVAKDSIDITATLVKCYYGVPRYKEINENGNIEEYYVTGTPGGTSYNAPILNNYKLAYIEEAVYKKANNIVADNRFSGESLQLTLKEKHPNKVDPTQINQDPVVLNYYDIEDFMPIVPSNDIHFSELQLNIIYSSLITLNKNIYNLESANEFVSLGTLLFNDVNYKYHVFMAGDVFTTNIINKVFTGVYNVFDDTTDVPKGAKIYNLHLYKLFNMYAPFSNHYIENGIAYRNFYSTIPINTSIGDHSYKDWRVEDVNRLNSFMYETVVRAKPVSNYFNTYIDALPPGLTEKTITYFPYRVYKGLAIPSESIQTNNLRFFPTNSYYDMPNDRGDIIALRGFNRGVYIQQRWSLFQSVISDKMVNDETEVYLGSSELFDRIPAEIIDNSNIGYIGSNSQFACFVFRDGYVGIDEERGKVFIVNSQTTEASQQNMKNSFREILPLGNHYIKKDIMDKNTKTDNPFLSVGYIVGFDEENNRLLITKKYYNPKSLTRLMRFDGEFYYDNNNNILDFNNPTYFYNESRTFSFALDSKTWVCEHDYFPNIYLYNNKGFFGIENYHNSNAKFYKFNSNNVNNGNYFGKQFESYVDLIFNTRLDISKQYQAVYWVSESRSNKDNSPYQFKTIDKIMLYTYHQCSGIIDIKNEYFENSRNVESKWQFNEFRDLAIKGDATFILKDGSFDSNTINKNKIWFERNLFIGNFIVTRLIWSNEENRTTYIHNVNIKSVNTQR